MKQESPKSKNYIFLFPNKGFIQAPSSSSFPLAKEASIEYEKYCRNPRKGWDSKHRPPEKAWSLWSTPIATVETLQHWTGLLKTSYAQKTQFWCSESYARSGRGAHAFPYIYVRWSSCSVFRWSLTLHLFTWIGKIIIIIIIWVLVFPWSWFYSGKGYTSKLRTRYYQNNNFVMILLYLCLYLRDLDVQDDGLIFFKHLPLIARMSASYLPSGEGWNVSVDNILETLLVM